MEKVRKGINLRASEFKQNLINVINESKLPPTLVGYILIDLIDLVKQNELEAIQEEEREYQEIKSKNKKEEK